MLQNEIENIYDTKMTQQELYEYYTPENVPRSPTSSEVNAIMCSGIERPIDYIFTHYYNQGGENWDEWEEIDEEYDEL
jgi:hypothetical protein